MKRFLLILILLYGIHLSGSAVTLGSSIRKNADSVFLFYPSRLAQFPFYSVFEQHTVCGNSGELKRSAGINISSLAMIFSGRDAIFQIKSDLNAEKFKKLAEKMGAVSVQPIQSEKQKGFRFSCSSTFGIRNDRALLLFTGKDEFLFGEEKKVRRYLESGKEGNDTLKKCFSLLRPDAAAYGILTSAKVRQNGFLQSGNADTVAFSLSRMPGMPSPVIAEVLFFPSAPSRLTPLYRELKDYITNVYRTAARKGPVSAEMRHAFTVSMSFGFVRLDMALTDKHGRDFFRILLSQWKN